MTTGHGVRTSCHRASSESLTLYFYGELPSEARAEVEQHVASCDACAAALADLELVRVALSHRAAVTRSRSEWDTFMRRLDRALDEPGHARSPGRALSLSTARGVWLALAATLVAGIAIGLAWQRRTLGPVHTQVADASASDAALTMAAGRHFERAKVVVLGLAMKDPASVTESDWAYERELAASLLPETRLFRLSAADRGDARLADLLGDLESVLLQASMSADAEPFELQRIQRVIRRRDLLVRMDLEESVTGL